jgi:hypothetical protein
MCWQCFAGFETTSHAITWSLSLLVSLPLNTGMDKGMNMTVGVGHA